MNRITFDAVINFYPEHNSWACGYPSRPKVLTKMRSNIRDWSKKDAVLKQIQGGQPLLELGGDGHA